MCIEQMQGIDSSPSGMDPEEAGRMPTQGERLRHLQRLTGDVTAG